MTTKRPPTLRNAASTFTAHLDGLTTDLAPEKRLAAALDALDILECLIDEARQVRAAALVDLRLPGLDGGRKGYSWPAIVELSGRDVTPQAVEQWARQHRPAVA